MSSDRFFSEVLKKSECEFEGNRDVAALTSSRISSVARAIAYPDSEEKLVDLISRLNDINAKYIVLGKMSNVLIKNGKYDGVIIKTHKINRYKLAESTLTLSCGASLSRIAQKMATLDLGGMEGLIGIPGTVGGMVRQNAGAFGYEISDRFKYAICYLHSTQNTVKLFKDDMQFAYRDSILAHAKATLINATFELIPKRYDDIVDEIESYRIKRLETQPITMPSLGCVFKRYNGVSAGYYIDKAGLKGYSIGGACVSRKHAGFIVNNGGATATDYLNLIEYVKERVFHEFNIELEEEIEII